MASKKRVTTDVVVEVTTPGGVLAFDYETWTAARNVWAGSGRRGGPIELFFMATEGELTEQTRAVLGEIVARARETLWPRPLSSSMGHDAAGAQLLDLIQTVWKLPHRHTTDSTDWIRVGKKNVAAWGAPDAPPVPTVGEVPAMQRALAMLEGVAASALPVTWKVVGPRYSYERR